MDSEVFIGGISEFKKIKEEDIVEQPEEEKSIYGTWQLKEYEYGAGDGSYDVTKVSNGYTMTFRKNNTFSRTEYVYCQSGGLVNGSFSLSTYSIYDFTVYMVDISFPCSYTNRKGEAIKHEKATKYTYSFKNEYLKLSLYDNPCDEGCGSNYKRVSE